jgi:anti-sigma regulatory factor (Ser/Thr protein kinase)
MIRVIDVGHGFDSARLQAENPLPQDERGRGLGLMQALVDRVDLTLRSEAGTIVTLEKALTYRDEALLAGRRKEV